MGNLCGKSSQTPSSNKENSSSIPLQKAQQSAPTKIKGIPMKPGEWFPIKNPFVNVGLGWDFNEGENFDLDASVTAFDECCEVVDGAVYYGHLKGFNDAIVHHGDNLTGVGDGDDEVISIHLDKLPSKIMSLAVTVNSYGGNSIIKAKEAFIRLFDGITNKEIGMFILNKTKDCIGLLLGMFERDNQNGGWFFRVMVDPISGNEVTKSYNDLKTLLTGYSANFQSDINYKPRHPMPGESELVPETWIDINTKYVFVGLGWDVLPGNIYDLDASIITFDMNFNAVDVVYHKNMKSADGAMEHHGDNRTGIGEGDDELLSIDFVLLDNNISTLAVIVNSFKGNSMVGLRSAFIRLFDRDIPIGCHVLGQGTETIGLLLGLFRKDTVNNRRLFQVFIQPIPGNEAPQAIDTLKDILFKYKMPL